jgi:hypothetical protein
MVNTGHFKVEIYFYPVFPYSSYDVLHLGFLTAAPLLHVCTIALAYGTNPSPSSMYIKMYLYVKVLQTPPLLLLFSTREKVY